MIDFWIGFFLIAGFFATISYFWALRFGCMAFVDVLWSLGLGLGAVAYLFYAGTFTIHRFMVLLVLLVWSFRLSYYLFTNRVLSGKEDPRYENLANYWGRYKKRNFYFLFLAQVLLMALFLVPVTTAMESGNSALQLADWIALAIAIISLVGETLSDRTLATFRADPANKGQVCQQGLWRYSRHPNYFFEWLHWWAYVAFAWGSATWSLSFIGPLAMYIFLNYITGIPHAERSSLKARGEAYRQYQKTTNSFFPWIPHQP